MDLDVVFKSYDCFYIVQCFGMFIINMDVFIVMEFMGICVEKFKKWMQGFIFECILGKMIVVIVKVLYYLKEKYGVIYCDVKFFNILLDEWGQIKFCDFGISGCLVDFKVKMWSVGCVVYMVFECIDFLDFIKLDYDIWVDVWSLGILLVELVIGQFFYKNCKMDFEVFIKVLQEEFLFLFGYMGFLGDFQFFVKDCFIKDYRKRLKYNKLFEYSFIKCYEMLEVDVVFWFKDVMVKIELLWISGVLSQFYLFFFRQLFGGGQFYRGLGVWLQVFFFIWLFSCLLGEIWDLDGY